MDSGGREDVKEESCDGDIYRSGWMGFDNSASTMANDMLLAQLEMKWERLADCLFLGYGPTNCLSAFSVHVICDYWLESCGGSLQNQIDGIMPQDL